MTDDDQRLPRYGGERRHTRIEPIRGNARRRTMVLLLGTGVAVLGVHFAMAGSPDGKTSPGGTPPQTKSSAESVEAAKDNPVPTFYVSTQGDDSADGTTPEKAWKTLGRADQHKFLAGERLLLRGGDTFTGTFSLNAGEAGQAAKPVIVGSYGTGQATIKAGQTPGIRIHDTAGVSISDLTLVGDGPLTSPQAGIDVYNDLPGDVLLDGVSIAKVDVSLFRDGISFVGGNGSSGFSHIEVTDSKLHGNRDNGLISDGPEGAALPAGKHQFHDFHVSGFEAFDNAGNPDNHKTSTGSGIDLGGVDGGLIENSVAHGNGGACDSASGPVGIWIHDATAFTIRHNVSYSNRTAGYTDGGGFDIDQSSVGTLMEQNLSYDNWGPGYMVYSSSEDDTSSGNTVRYNVSIDDARGPKNADSITYGALMLAGYEKDLSVHHNTIQQSSTAEKAKLVNLGGHLLIGLHLENTTIRDNIFAGGGGPLLDAGVAPATKQVLMQGNDYFSAAGKWRMNWGGSTYTSMAAWRKATGQETVKSTGQGTVKSTATGTDANPGLVAVGPVSWDPTHKPVSAPKAGSAVVLTALDLTAEFGTDIGTADFFDSPVVESKMIGAVVPKP